MIQPYKHKEKYYRKTSQGVQQSCTQIIFIKNCQIILCFVLSETKEEISSLTP